MKKIVSAKAQSVVTALFESICEKTSALGGVVKRYIPKFGMPHNVVLKVIEFEGKKYVVGYHRTMCGSIRHIFAFDTSDIHECSPDNWLVTIRAGEIIPGDVDINDKVINSYGLSMKEDVDPRARTFIYMFTTDFYRSIKPDCIADEPQPKRDLLVPSHKLEHKKAICY